MKLGERLIWVLDYASKLGALAGSALCFAMMALITIDVIVRATLNISIFGAIELAEFGLVLMAFFAQAAAYTSGRHIKVDFFVQRASPRVMATLELITLSISLAIMTLMSIATIAVGIETLEENESSFALQLPVGMFKLAAGVGLILLSFAMLRRWITLISGVIEHTQEPQQ